MECSAKGMQFRHNSLIAGARIRAVEVADGRSEEENQVRAVTMEFEGLLKNLVQVAGWHLTTDRRVPTRILSHSSRG